MSPLLLGARRTSQLLVPGPGRVPRPHFIDPKHQHGRTLVDVLLAVPRPVRLVVAPVDLEKSSKKIVFPLNTTTAVASPHFNTPSPRFTAETQLVIKLR